jgi:hypothetical protein
MHTISQAISHTSTGESKSARKVRRTQDVLQNHVILTSHKLYPHINSQLEDLTWQECQATEEAPHLGASHSTTKVFSSTSKWMKP